MSYYHQIDDKSQQRRILAVVAFSIFSLTINSSMISSFLVNITEGLEVNMTMGSWLIMAFLIGLVGSMIVVAKMSQYGKIKKTFVTGVSVYVITLFLCAISNNFYAITVLSFFQGIGASVLAIAAPVLVVTFMPGNRKGMGMGIFSAASGLGYIIGPLLGGWIVDFGWQFIFISILPFAVITLFLGSAWIPAADGRTASDEHIDVLGGALLIVIIGGAIFLINSVMSDFGPYAIIITIILMIASAVILVSYEKRKTVKIFNMKLLRNRNIILLLISTLLTSSMVAGLQYLSPYYLKGALNTDSMTSGLILSFSYVMMFVSSFFIGRYCDRKGCKIPLICTNSLRLLICIIAAICAVACPLALFIILVAMLGLSCGFASTSQSTSLAHNVKRNDQPDVASFGMVATYLGSSLGMSLYNLICAFTVPGYSGSIGSASAELIEMALRNTSIFGAIICFIALLLVLIVPNIDPSKDKVE